MRKMMQALDLTVPIIQAPMAGGATTPELVAAVSNAGGLGSLGAGYMSPEAITTAIHAIRRLTSKPFAVNLFIPEKINVTPAAMNAACLGINQSSQSLRVETKPVYPPFAVEFDAQMKAVLEARVPVFSFTFGMLAPQWLKKLKQHRVVILGTATSIKEATLLELSGVDGVVLQGSQAGGHRGTFEGAAEESLFELRSLLTQCQQALGAVPLIAAGGIATRQDVTAVLSCGASLVQIGTSFLTTHESGIHPAYKNCLLALKRDETTLTRVFSGKLARGLSNKFIQKMREKNTPLLDYPAQNALTKTLRDAAKSQNNPEYMSMWAGQSAALCRDCSAADLIDNLLPLELK
jgi:nitronate monooxygenase